MQKAKDLSCPKSHFSVVPVIPSSMRIFLDFSLSINVYI